MVVAGGRPSGLALGAINGPVSLRIFDMLGREVANVFDGERDAGTYVVDWNASSFPSGIYFAVADFGQSRQTRKLMLLR